MQTFPEEDQQTESPLLVNSIALLGCVWFVGMIFGDNEMIFGDNEMVIPFIRNGMTIHLN